MIFQRNIIKFDDILLLIYSATYPQIDSLTKSKDGFAFRVNNFVNLCIYLCMFY